MLGFAASAATRGARSGAAAPLARRAFAAAPQATPAAASEAMGATSAYMPPGAREARLLAPDKRLNAYFTDYAGLCIINGTGAALATGALV